MAIANKVRIILQRLKLIEKLILYRETPWLLSEDDKKIKDEDSQVIKALKKALKPETKTVGTQTETLYLLTPEEKTALDEKIADFNKKLVNNLEALRKAWGKNYEVQVELDKTKQALVIETQAREDAIIKNDNLQKLYESETKDLQEKITNLNKDLDYMATNYANSSVEKDEKVKQIQKEAQEVREKLEAIHNVRKVSIEIQAKPEMKDA